MFIGFYVSRLSGIGHISPPFARGGQGIVLAADVFDVPGGGTALAILVQHKNLEDTAWVSLGSFTPISSMGVKHFDASGCKEQLRLVFTVSGGASPQVYDTFYLDMLPPVWRP